MPGVRRIGLNDSWIGGLTSAELASGSGDGAGGPPGESPAGSGSGEPGLAVLLRSGLPLALLDYLNNLVKS